jgi:hypothetical protein
MGFFLSSLFFKNGTKNPSAPCDLPRPIGVPLGTSLLGIPNRNPSSPSHTFCCNSSRPRLKRTPSFSTASRSLRRAAFSLHLNHLRIMLALLELVPLPWCNNRKVNTRTSQPISSYLTHWLTPLRFPGHYRTVNTGTCGSNEALK